MKEFVTYTALRLVLFAGALGIVYGVWAALSDSVPLFWVILIAFVASGIGSFFILNRQREAFAQRVDARAQRAADRFEQSRAKEDAD